MIIYKKFQYLCLKIERCHVLLSSISVQNARTLAPLSIIIITTWVAIKALKETFVVFSECTHLPLYVRLYLVRYWFYIDTMNWS